MFLVQHTHRGDMESLQGTKCSSTVRFCGFWRRICLHSNGMLWVFCKTFKKLHWTPYRWFISSWLRKSHSSLRMSLTCLIPCCNHFCHRKGLFWMVIYRFSHITWFLTTALLGCSIACISDQTLWTSASVQVVGNLGILDTNDVTLDLVGCY